MQESRVVRIIRKQLIKRALDMMTDLMGKGEEEYEKFWSQFGRNLKLGVVDDPENKDKLASLLRVSPTPLPRRHSPSEDAPSLALKTCLCIYIYIYIHICMV